ncbi:serine/threonine-protein kinase [Streptomyces sp. NBC_01565]|uniref:serine/threonine-protein kinase n=1 Tax=Streptomyces sp. NBC_01565 TaxID=2975881 RepID=UPI002259281F|nr:serine/threonine-protein kinase [Streptomyces sp. NBC_01565]MCX4539590.1 serine/threonine protein kinase [Streptomyces sp. NBC_01565]
MTRVRGLGASWGSSHTELLPPGHRVGDWVVTEPIGAGGWATVYAGRPAGDRADGRADAAEVAEVALKIMPTSGLAPRQARNVAEAARREVEIGVRAGHPRLVRLLDSIVLSTPEHPTLDGAIVLVMERATGSLRDLLDTGVSEAEGGRLIAGICEGLAHLHRVGWVHADLKPENVLIGADGSVKLSDFGLATELTGTHGHAAPMGTLDYLPPERWKAPLGELGVEVRPSADIWALGIVIHEVFASGAPLFSGATPVARGAAVQEYAAGRAPLRMANAVPEFWRALAADCLAPTHAARAAHTAESLLERITARQAPAARSRAARAFRLRRATRAALLAVAACGAVGGALWSYAGREDGSGAQAGTAEPPLPVRVFNAERVCRDRTDRDPQCSLGLAIDPMRPYTAGNVVPTRVWHADVLEADCQLLRGEAVIDESDLRSTHWFRVRLPGPDPGARAWLPAVRTKDRPDLPPCPTPKAAR